MADLKPQFLQTRQAESVKPVIERLFGQRYRVTRRLDAAQGLKLLPELFEEYGGEDIANVSSLPKLADLRLIRTGMPDVDRTATDKRVVVLIYETLTGELVQEDAAVVTRDENGRATARIPYVGLPGASGGLSVGQMLTIDGVEMVVAGTEKRLGDEAHRVVYVAKEAGVALTPLVDGAEDLIPGLPANNQKGTGDRVTQDADRRHLRERDYIQLASVTYAEPAAGNYSILVEGVTYVYAGETRGGSAAVRTVTRRFVEATAAWEAVGPDKTDRETNGLLRVNRLLVAVAGTTPPSLVVGTTTYDFGGTVCYLAGYSDAQSDRAVSRLAASYIEAGIVEADKQFDADAGLLYVTFQSVGVKVVPTCLKSGSALTDDPTVAFQGGAPASIFRDRIRNVKGLRTFIVTVMMKVDGSALATNGNENIVNSHQVYLQYPKPGEVSVGSGGIYASPGNQRYLLAQVDEVLTTASTLPAGYKPFSVKNWAGVNASFIPAAEAVPIIVSKGAQGYLADSSYAGQEWNGVPVESASAVASSDPTPSVYYALTNQVISSGNGPAFITDTGQRWYRRRKVTVVGALSQLNT